MQLTVPGDIQALEDALSAAEHDARELVAGLTEELGTWRAERDSWSVAPGCGAFRGLTGSRSAQPRN